MIKEYILKLTKEEKKVCLNNWGNKEYKELIFKANLPLALHIAKKYHVDGIEYDDIEQMAIIGLWKGIMSYKLEKNVPLSSYCGRCINNEIGMYIKKEQPRIEMIGSRLSDPIGSNDGHEQTIEDTLFDEDDQYSRIESVDYMRYLFKGLKEDEVDIISKMYIQDVPQKKIVEEYGCSQSNIAKKARIGKNKIKQKLEVMI